MKPRPFFLILLATVIFVGISQTKPYTKPGIHKYLDSEYKTYYARGSRAPDIITLCSYPKIFYHRLGSCFIIPTSVFVGDWKQVDDTIYMQPRLELEVGESIFEYSAIPEGITDIEFLKQQKFIVKGDTIIDVTPHWAGEDSLGNTLTKVEPEIYIQAKYER